VFGVLGYPGYVLPVCFEEIRAEKVEEEVLWAINSEIVEVEEVK
jgi:hypothetical protein